MADLAGCSKKLPPTKRVYELSSNVEDILKKSTDLSTAEYHALVSELIKRSPCSTEELKKEMNLARDLAGKKNKVCAHPRNDDAGACNSFPATRVNLICHGDLIAAKHVFFLDTEKVTESQTHENLSGDLAVVDEKGVLVFCCYILRGQVCKYNTKLTGLNAQKLANGPNIETVQVMLEKCFKGKEIWGAATENDLKSLNYGPSKLPPFTLRDIQDFYRDFAGNPISLAYLTEHFFGENTQGAQHSSIRDARITAICYKKMILFKNQGMNRFSCPVMDDLRRDPKNNPNKRQKNFFEKCTCGKAKKGNKGKMLHGKFTDVVESTTGDFNVDDWV